MTRMTKLGVVVVAVGALVGLAPSAHGQASFRPRFTAQAPIPVAVGLAAGRQAMALADLNADQRPDLVAIAPDDDQVAVRLNDGSGGFAAATSVDLQLTPTAVAVADVTSPFGGAASGFKRHMTRVRSATRQSASTARRRNTAHCRCTQSSRLRGSHPRTRAASTAR